MMDDLNFTMITGGSGICMKIARDCFFHTIPDASELASGFFSLLPHETLVCIRVLFVLSSYLHFLFLSVLRDYHVYGLIPLRSNLAPHDTQTSPVTSEMNLAGSKSSPILNDVD